jgi:hypothetical protein
MGTYKRDAKKSQKNKKKAVINSNKSTVMKSQSLKKKAKKRETIIKIDDSPTPLLNNNINSVLSWFLHI